MAWDGAAAGHGVGGPGTWAGCTVPLALEGMPACCHPFSIAPLFVVLQQQQLVAVIPLNGSLAHYTVCFRPRNRAALKVIAAGLSRCTPAAPAAYCGGSHLDKAPVFADLVQAA